MTTVYKRGFTLIELLVVIAIIGILAGIVLASLNNARSGATDAKAKEQLSNLRTAMELYYTTNGNYGASVTACNAGAFASSGVAPLVSSANYSNALACGASSSAWAVWTTLSTSEKWCVDSTGKAGTSTVTGTPTVCP